MTVTILRGDCRERLQEIEAGMFHTCVTSPPYWGLRDYGLGPDALGLEPTPDLYVAHIVEVFREVWRVLRDDGTCWLNLGDSYASGKGTCYNPGGGDNSLGKTRKDAGAHPLDRGNKSTLEAVGLKPKDLVGIPWRVAFALQADGWWLRSDIIWHKPNCMPESVTDRPTKSHEYLFLLSKSARYFFDQDAVREENAENPNWHRPKNPEQYMPPSNMGLTEFKRKLGAVVDTKKNAAGKGATGWQEWPRNGRNIRSVWTIPTSPYKEAHFATMPPALVEPCIKAGTSERGCCPECGAAWERVVEKGEQVACGHGDSKKYSLLGRSESSIFNTGTVAQSTTIGWRPGCLHYGGVDQWLEYEPNRDKDPEIDQRNEAIRAIRTLLMEKFEQYENLVPCRVLDPFFGAGTVGLVSDRLARDCTGIDLSEEYVDMAEKRITSDAPMFAGVSVG